MVDVNPFHGCPQPGGLFQLLGVQEAIVVSVVKLHGPAGRLGVGSIGLDPRRKAIPTARQAGNQ